MDTRSIVRGSAVVVSNPFQGWVQLRNARVPWFQGERTALHLSPRPRRRQSYRDVRLKVPVASRPEYISLPSRHSSSSRRRHRASSPWIFGDVSLPILSSRGAAIASRAKKRVAIAERRMLVHRWCQG